MPSKGVYLGLISPRGLGRRAVIQITLPEIRPAGPQFGLGFACINI